VRRGALEREAGVVRGVAQVGVEADRLDRHVGQPVVDDLGLAARLEIDQRRQRAPRLVVARLHVVEAVADHQAEVDHDDDRRGDAEHDHHAALARRDPVPEITCAICDRHISLLFLRRPGTPARSRA
jgi:hypothetical protein